jgi:thymidylate kinase
MFCRLDVRSLRRRSWDDHGIHTAWLAVADVRGRTPRPRRYQTRGVDPEVMSQPTVSTVGADAAEDQSASRSSVLLRLDAAIDRRVLVSGALPPAGRDLDLIVRVRERKTAREVLARMGFLPRGGRAVPVRRLTEQWARFVGCDVDVVDLNPAERWRLTRPALTQLFEDALPVGDLEHVARPSPAHSLLLLARRLAGDGALNSKRLARIPDLLRLDPDAWQRAAALASDWRVDEALSRLRDGWLRGDDDVRITRARSIARRAVSTSPRSLVASALAEASARRPRDPKIVAVSGLDGSGKSTQVLALRRTLESLGVDVQVEWKPLGHNASVRLLRRIVKRVVAKARGMQTSDLDALKVPGRSLVAGPEPTLLRRQNRVLTQIWATMVAVASATHFRFVTLRSLGTGRVILFDRYALDTVAQLRFFYGEQRAFAVQRHLVRAICPKPMFAVLLEIPGTVALARKPEQYDLAQLEAQARLLHEESGRFRVHAIAGTRPTEEICEEVARKVWSGLR